MSLPKSWDGIREGARLPPGSGDGIEGVFRPSFLVAGPGIASSVTAGPDAALEPHGFLSYSVQLARAFPKNPFAFCSVRL